MDALTSLKLGGVLSFNERQLAVPLDLVLERLDYSNSCLLAIPARHGVATAVSHDPFQSIFRARYTIVARATTAVMMICRNSALVELHRDEPAISAKGVTMECTRRVPSDAQSNLYAYQHIHGCMWSGT